MGILLPDSDNEKEDDTININYNASDVDEECFFLMYHMNVQPSEARNLDPEYRKWIIARFVAQKNMEQEAVARHQLMNQIGPDLKNLHI
jgi:hypothetical protein